MSRQLEVQTGVPNLSELAAVIKSLPVLIYDGSEPVSGLATVENENVLPQTRRIIELAGHSVTGEARVRKITYINRSSSKQVDISVGWESDHRANKYHVPSIVGLRLMMQNGRNEFKPFVMAIAGGVHHISEDYDGPFNPEEFDKAKELIKKFKRFPASIRESFVMEIIGAIKDFPHKMPWNPSGDI